MKNKKSVFKKRYAKIVYIFCAFLFYKWPALKIWRNEVVHGECLGYHYYFFLSLILRSHHLLVVFLFPFLSFSFSILHSHHQHSNQNNFPDHLQRMILSLNLLVCIYILLEVSWYNNFYPIWKQNQSLLLTGKCMWIFPWLLYHKNFWFVTARLYLDF